jgi:hypothetical protein
MATEYTAVEIAFLRLIIETIVTANNHEFSVSSTAGMFNGRYFKFCLYFVVLRREMGVADDSTLKQFTKVQAEQLIDRFVHDGWLLHSRQGKLSLAMRTVLELEIYLKATFGDELLDCHRCRKLVITQGYFCPSDGCGVALHKHCAQVIFRIQGQQQCPGCRHDIKYGSN